MNESESAAMWRLYSQTTEAIAIVTTAARLHALVTKIDVNAQVASENKFIPLLAPLVGIVKYANYETDAIPIGNGYYPLFHKRSSFAHENEVRALSSVAGAYLRCSR
jgi:hypothetical protein